MSKFNSNNIDEIMAMYQKGVDSVEIMNTYDINEDQFQWFKMGVITGRTDGRIALINMVYADKIEKGV